MQILYSRVSVKCDIPIVEKLLGTSIVDVQAISPRKTSRTYIKGQRILRVITPSWTREMVMHQIEVWEKQVDCKITLFSNYKVDKNIAMLFLMDKKIEIPNVQEG